MSVDLSLWVSLSHLYLLYWVISAMIPFWTLGMSSLLLRRHELISSWIAAGRLFSRLALCGNDWLGRTWRSENEVSDLGSRKSLSTWSKLKWVVPLATPFLRHLNSSCGLGTSLFSLNGVDLINRQSVQSSAWDVQPQKRCLYPIPSIRRMASSKRSTINS